MMMMMMMMMIFVYAGDGDGDGDDDRCAYPTWLPLTKENFGGPTTRQKPVDLPPDRQTP